MSVEEEKGKTTCTALWTSEPTPPGGIPIDRPPTPPPPETDGTGTEEEVEGDDEGAANSRQLRLRERQQRSHPAESPPRNQAVHRPPRRGPARDSWTMKLPCGKTAAVMPPTTAATSSTKNNLQRLLTQHRLLTAEIFVLQPSRILIFPMTHPQRRQNLNGDPHTRLVA